METLSPSPAPRLHPLVVAAAASVTVVSLLGAAAIAGIFPSHSNATPVPLTAAQMSGSALPVSVTETPAIAPASVPVQASATRFQTPDGRIFEEVPQHASANVVDRASYAPAAEVRAPVHHIATHKPVHHYTQQTSYQPSYGQEQQHYPQHPVRNYVNDMNPVGTGMGAVVGGLLGNQVGGGNGKKLATVAGVLLGGYAGNEVAHDRNPLPFAGR